MKWPGRNLSTLWRSMDLKNAGRENVVWTYVKRKWVQWPVVATIVMAFVFLKSQGMS
jgi:hypothetical protein